MPGRHTEAAFESAIEEHLVSSGGNTRGDRDAFDRERCIDAGTFLAFVRETQPREWEYLESLQKDKAESILLDDLCRGLNSEHEGFKGSGERGGLNGVFAGKATQADAGPGHRR